MKRLFFLLLILSLALPALARDVHLNDSTAQVFFSPHGGCTEAAVDAIGHAKASILVQAYSMTSRPIAEALIAAQARGVVVKVMSDRTNETGKGSVTHDLQAAGIDVGYDEVHKIAHSKIMIIDGATVLTGSFNWTASAENVNSENLIILHSPEMAQVYAERWKELRKICVER